MSEHTITKKILLRAPLERVWHAVSDSASFGAWFGARFEGPFVAGQRVRGQIAPTQMDPTIAAMQEPYSGLPCDLLIERLEPPRLLSFRWHPGAEGGDLDGVTTLVTFELADAEGGTLLTITESGFEHLPPERRAKAFSDNEGGWELQTTLIAKYVHAA